MGISEWELLALRCEKIYGVQVDFNERFFICPECGEPIYECDWSDDELETCPVCGFGW